MHISASSGSILLFLVSKCLLLLKYLACSGTKMWISKIKKIWFCTDEFWVLNWAGYGQTALHVQWHNKLWGGGYLTTKSYQSVSWPTDIVALHFSHSGHLDSPNGFLMPAHYFDGISSTFKAESACSYYCYWLHYLVHLWELWWWNWIQMS